MPISHAGLIAFSLRPTALYCLRFYSRDDAPTAESRVDVDLGSPLHSASSTASASNTAAALGGSGPINRRQ